MRRTSLAATCLTLAATFLPILPSHSSLLAQDRGSLFGTLFDQQTLQPLPGATISLTGEAATAVSEADGSFVFSELSVGLHTLRIAAPGFATSVEQIEITAGELTFLQFSLLPFALTLDEILVLSGRRRTTGAAVATVAADPDGLALTATDLLAQKVPGLSLSRGGAGVGSGSRIQMRGISSFTQNSPPSIFLDGIRINDQANARSIFGSNVSLSVLDNIPASHIRRIRVLRGASAAAQFGDSANGVILIETHAGSQD